ncbi:hypothetical protein Pmani_005184 [Petrolisthes manimaculis]|uniref:Uncharacterized protein n=1 Tax=Petrolisthes manimaculis TaxID=1843537 RepID=A0AAE1QCP1_9EUCA|nr:hypothetical protein Pmani_005184 [Petrolisthes manimaculis]
MATPSPQLPTPPKPPSPPTSPIPLPITSPPHPLPDTPPPPGPTTAPLPPHGSSLNPDLPEPHSPTSTTTPSPLHPLSSPTPEVAEWLVFWTHTIETLRAQPTPPYIELCLSSLPQELPPIIHIIPATPPHPTSTPRRCAPSSCPATPLSLRQERRDDEPVLVPDGFTFHSGRTIRIPRKYVAANYNINIHPL